MPTTLGTAHLSSAPGGYLLRYINIGNWRECEQHFADINAALYFCRIRGLQVHTSGMDDKYDE